MDDTALENHLRLAFRAEAAQYPLTVTVADVQRRLGARRRERERTRAWFTAVAAVLLVAVGAAAFLLPGRGRAPSMGDASTSPAPASSASPSADPSPSATVSPPPTASPLHSPTATRAPDPPVPSTPPSLPAPIAPYPGWTERASLAGEATAGLSEHVLHFELSQEEASLTSAVCTGVGVIDLAIDEVNSWTVECPRIEDPRRLVSFFLLEQGPQDLRLTVPGHVAFRVLVEVTTSPWPQLFLSHDDERIELQGTCAAVQFAFERDVRSDLCGIDLTSRAGITWAVGSSAEITAAGNASWRITSGRADCGRVPTDSAPDFTPDASCRVTTQLVDGVMQVQRIEAPSGRWMLHAELTSTNEVGDWIADDYHAELVMP